MGLDKEPNVSKSFRNIPGMEIYQARKPQHLRILKYKYLVIANPKEAIDGLESRTLIVNTTDSNRISILDINFNINLWKKKIVHIKNL